MNRKCLPVVVAMITWFLSSPASADVSRPDEGSGPTEVRMTIFMVDLDDVDTANQNFTVNIALLASWRDERLVHDNAAGKVTHPLVNVWHPRFQWLNQQKIWETFPHTVEVSPEGNVTYTQRVWGQFSQLFRLQDFPFDEQEFNVTLIAAGHTPDEVQIIEDPEFPSGMADQLSVADWIVTDWKTITGVYEPLINIKPNVTFVFNFKAKRGTRYFTFTIIIPLILIVAMSWVVFWIDPKESGTQIGVAMTSMLTLIAYRFAVASSLPNIPYLTRMDIFLVGATFLVFASLVEVIITSYFARSERLELARRIDGVMRPLFPLALVGVFAAAFLRT